VRWTYYESNIRNALRHTLCVLARARRIERERDDSISRKDVARVYVNEISKIVFRAAIALYTYVTFYLRLDDSVSQNVRANITSYLLTIRGTRGSNFRL